MTPQILRVYLCDQTERGCILDSSLKLGRFLVDRYVGCRVERTYLLCLDNTGRLMACGPGWKGCCKPPRRRKPHEPVGT